MRQRGPSARAAGASISALSNCMTANCVLYVLGPSRCLKQNAAGIRGQWAQQHAPWNCV